jgi:phosphoglycerate dehydrogenase-like enzyme
LIEGLRSGALGGAGLDVFAVEPLAAEHPFWTMPNVLVSPHYSGAPVTNSSLPVQWFVRNLRAYQEGNLAEGLVDLD